MYLLPVSIFSEQTRPKVILALSGGAARGLAHIGILEYLEENHIPIDGIAGTSMGGLIGGSYTMGHSIPEIKKMVSQLDFEKLLSLNLNYADLSVETKKKLKKYPLSINLTKSKNSLENSSIYESHYIAQFFDRLTLSYSHINDFNQLPIPFKCVATDIVKGESITLDKGLLPRALKATMAIPGLFPPVVWDDKILVDGGVLNNLPVDVAKTMGEIVIAVDVSEGLKPKDKLHNFSSVVNQTIAVMMLQSIKKNRQLSNIYIKPDIQAFGLMDLKKSNEIIQKGYEAAKKMSTQLLPLALGQTEWNNYLTIKNSKKTLHGTQKIDYLAVHSKNPDVADWLAKEIHPLVENDDILDLKKLESNLTLAMDKVGASKVHYRLIDPISLEEIKKPNEKYTTAYRKINNPIYLSEEGLNEFKEKSSVPLKIENGENEKKIAINDSSSVKSSQNTEIKSEGFGIASPNSESSQNTEKISEGFGIASSSTSSLQKKSEGFGIEIVSVDDNKSKTNLSTGIQLAGSGDNVQLNLGSRLAKQTPTSSTELDVNVGTNINLAYGYRFKIGQAISIKPQVFFSNELENYKSGIIPYPLLTDRTTSYGANLDLNWDIKNIIGLRGRYQWRKVNMPNVFINSVGNVQSGNFQTVSLKATYDRQNSASIVTNGLKITAEATYYLNSPKVQNSTLTKKPLKVDLQGAYAHPVGKGILRFNGGMGYISNNTLPLNEGFSLGGPLKLSSFQEGELRNASYVFTNIGFLYPITSFSFFPSKKTYVTIWGERGGVGSTIKNVVMNQNIFTGLLMDSTLGPVFIGASYGADKRFNFHFGIGNFF